MTAADEIKKLWQIVASGSTSILELRAIWPHGILPAKKDLTQLFRAAEFMTVDECRLAFEAEALRLTLKALLRRRRYVPYDRRSMPALKWAGGTARRLPSACALKML